MAVKIDKEALKQDLQSGVSTMTSFSCRNKWGGTHAREGHDYRGDLYLRRIPINRQGYDSSGKYYGTGKPVYEVESEGPEVDFFIRVYDRADAVAEVGKCYPNAKVRKGQP